MFTPLPLVHSMRALRMRRAFTLTELLVVIAVIAILAVILLSVLGSVRSAAKKTQCASNLRQVGTGFHMYLQEYNSLVPIAWVNDQETQEAFGLPYRGGWFDYYTGHLPEEERSIVGCPLQRENKYDIWKGYNWTDAKIDKSRTYSFSGDLGYDLSAKKVIPKAYSRFESPVDTVVIADGNNSDANGQAGYYNSTFHHGRMPEGVHDGMANLLFLDGHVDSVAVDSIPTDISAGAYGRLFWFGSRQ
ncbi:prepilin-type N-terminal cleavage/methylation domain-containing protein [Cerasicoccus frondis]|uniref:prepilin-type N-terminal cleavage/methylation domain-containing protein n=1 Tax=Cerasicoccus frondis TaxID=490090 RepID=UPI00285275C3|nr:prepilin-type N-terminal cleavage/methylation domain-containing protein [Cerasicoccus frondis]